LAWTVEISDVAEHQLKKLDRPVQKRILNWLADRIEGCKDPRHFGEPLKCNYAAFWRDRIGNYRVICEIQDDIVVVLVLNIGHRRQRYR
jgi:mRNA interferase RelE/StbE